MGDKVYTLDTSDKAALDQLDKLADQQAKVTGAGQWRHHRRAFRGRSQVGRSRSWKYSPRHVGLFFQIPDFHIVAATPYVMF